MTPEAVTALAQSEPVESLTRKLGEFTVAARKEVDRLSHTLRWIDSTRAKLDAEGLAVMVDLGPIGNAAAAARRDLEKQKPHTFEMPKAS